MNTPHLIYFDLIEKYYNGKLTGNDLLDFEQKKVEDEKLRKEIWVFDNMIEGLKMAEKERLRRMFTKRDEYLDTLLPTGIWSDDNTSQLQPPSASSTSVIPLYRRYKWWLSAAAILLFTFSAYLWVGTQYSSPHIAQKFDKGLEFSTPVAISFEEAPKHASSTVITDADNNKQPQVVTPKEVQIVPKTIPKSSTIIDDSASDSMEETAAEKLINEATDKIISEEPKYEEALQLFEDATNYELTIKQSVDINYYSALCHFAQKDYTKTVKLLQKIPLHNSSINWYLALSYLYLQQSENAITHLKILSENKEDDRYMSEAQAMLEELKYQKLFGRQ